jgi:hypothetical protein
MTTRNPNKNGIPFINQPATFGKLKRTLTGSSFAMLAMTPLALGLIGCPGGGRSDAKPNISVQTMQHDVVVTAGHKVQLEAKVKGADPKKLSWAVLGANGGTVSATGLYTAPATIGTYQVEARVAGVQGATDRIKVRVIPAPEAQALVVTPDQQIARGQQVTLTPRFTGGTAKIEPGSLKVEDGKPYEFTASSDITYRLIVTNEAGTAAEATADIKVFGSAPQTKGIQVAGPSRLGATQVAWADVQDGDTLEWTLHEGGVVRPLGRGSKVAFAPRAAGYDLVATPVSLTGNPAKGGAPRKGQLSFHGTVDTQARDAGDPQLDLPANLTAGEQVTVKVTNPKPGVAYDWTLRHDGASFEGSGKSAKGQEVVLQVGHGPVLDLVCVAMDETSHREISRVHPFVAVHQPAEQPKVKLVNKVDGAGRLSAQVESPHKDVQYLWELREGRFCSDTPGQEPRFSDGHQVEFQVPADSIELTCWAINGAGVRSAPVKLSSPVEVATPATNRSPVLQPDLSQIPGPAILDRDGKGSQPDGRRPLEVRDAGEVKGGGLPERGQASMPTTTLGLGLDHGARRDGATASLPEHKRAITPVIGTENKSRTPAPSRPRALSLDLDGDGKDRSGGSAPHSSPAPLMGDSSRDTAQTRPLDLSSSAALMNPMGTSAERPLQAPPDKPALSRLEAPDAEGWFTVSVAGPKAGEFYSWKAEGGALKGMDGSQTTEGSARLVYGDRVQFQKRGDGGKVICRAFNLGGESEASEVRLGVYRPDAPVPGSGSAGAGDQRSAHREEKGGDGRGQASPSSPRARDWHSDGEVPDAGDGSSSDSDKDDSPHAHPGTGASRQGSLATRPVNPGLPISRRQPSLLDHLTVATTPVRNPAGSGRRSPEPEAQVKPPTPTIANLQYVAGVPDGSAEAHSEAPVARYVWKLKWGRLNASQGEIRRIPGQRLTFQFSPLYDFVDLSVCAYNQENVRSEFSPAMRVWRNGSAPAGGQGQSAESASPRREASDRSGTATAPLESRNPGFSPARGSDPSPLHRDTSETQTQPLKQGSPRRLSGPPTGLPAFSQPGQNPTPTAPLAKPEIPKVLKLKRLDEEGNHSLIVVNPQDGVTYAWRIEGGSFNNSVSPQSFEGPSAEFNVPEGEARVTCRAVNAEGVSSEPSAARVKRRKKVMPPALSSPASVAQAEPGTPKRPTPLSVDSPTSRLGSAPSQPRESEQPPSLGGNSRSPERERPAGVQPREPKVKLGAVDAEGRRSAKVRSIEDKDLQFVWQVLPGTYNPGDSVRPETVLVEVVGPEVAFQEPAGPYSLTCRAVNARASANDMFSTPKVFHLGGSHQVDEEEADREKKDGAGQSTPGAPASASGHPQPEQGPKSAGKKTPLGAKERIKRAYQALLRRATPVDKPSDSTDMPLIPSGRFVPDEIDRVEDKENKANAKQLKASKEPGSGQSAPMTRAEKEAAKKKKYQKARRKRLTLAKKEAQRLQQDQGQGAGAAE